MSRGKRRARQQMPRPERAVPQAERRSLQEIAADLVREAKAQGHKCIVELGDDKTPYKGLISVEILPKREEPNT